MENWIKAATTGVIKMIILLPVVAIERKIIGTKIAKKKATSTSEKINDFILILVKNN